MNNPCLKLPQYDLALRIIVNKAMEKL